MCSERLLTIYGTGIGESLVMMGLMHMWLLIIFLGGFDFTNPLLLTMRVSLILILLLRFERKKFNFRKSRLVYK